MMKLATLNKLALWLVLGVVALQLRLVVLGGLGGWLHMADRFVR